MSAYYTQSHTPSLLITTNGANARFFEIESDDVHVVDEIMEKRDRYSDREGYFTNSAHQYMVGGEPDVVNARQEQFVRQHLHEVAKKTEELWQEEESNYKHIVLIVPQHHAHTLVEQIHKRLPGNRIYVYYGNYVQEVHPHKIRALFQDALKPSRSHHTHER